MKKSPWVCGLCIGMVAGAAALWMSEPKKCRKTMVGKTMQRMGNAVDTALDDLNDRLR